MGDTISFYTYLIKSHLSTMLCYSRYDEEATESRSATGRGTLYQKGTRALTFQERNRELVGVQVIDVFPQVGVEDPGYKPFQHDYIPKTRCLQITDHSLLLSLMVTEESGKKKKKKEKEINEKT